MSAYRRRNRKQQQRGRPSLPASIKLKPPKPPIADPTAVNGHHIYHATNILHSDIDLEAAAIEYFKDHLTPEEASVEETRPQQEDLDLYDEAMELAKVC